MPFRTFQSLLRAGYRLQAREYLMAASAAAFPHMQDRARKDFVRRLEGAGDTPTEWPAPTSQAEPGSGWDNLRAYAQRDAARIPLTATATAKLTADQKATMAARQDN